jgi:CPA1 family monovalent cation:H+ antiporter
VTELLLIGVIGLLAIALATSVAPRVGLSAPVILVLLGIGVSFLPFIPNFEIEPEWILAGILPPLLYSASVSMPTMNFRREFGAISGLSVVLVVVSSVVLGLLFAWLIPGLGLAWGIALGAIVSPTDAVATSIVKRTGVSPRVVAILEGESLLNDATALVLLRTAIASVAAAISFWSVIGTFAFSVIVPLIIGYIVGRLNLIVRARVRDATVNTVISFTVPFLASIPAELLGASGLVAAVVAGLITGRRAPRVLSPEHRLSDAQNWRTVELVLEGAIFLTMGLELDAIVTNVQEDHAGLGPAIILALIALLATIIVRAAYVAPLLGSLRRRARRGEKFKPRVQRLQQALDDPDAPLPAIGHERVGRGRPGRDLVGRKRLGRNRQHPTRPLDKERIGTRARRAVADIDYFLEAPLGWREGAVVVWAGMRGAITVAAAQTLPPDTPHRSLLVLIAFAVAALSLLMQGGTLESVIRLVRPASQDPNVARDEHHRLMNVIDAVTLESDTASPTEHELALIAAKRTVLLDARDDGTFDAEVLAEVLTALDAEQLSLQLRADAGD